MACNCTKPNDVYAEIAARTDSFRKGAPRSFALSAAGHRAAFLRSAGPEIATLDLWVIDDLAGQPAERLLVAASQLLADDEQLSAAERARRERLRESGAGITSFSHDELLSTVAFSLSGQLWICDAASGNAVRVGAYESVVDPRLNPRGDGVAFTEGADFVVYNLATDTELYRLSAETDTVTYGLADFVAAEELDRYRGHWWSPTADRLLVERNDEAQVEVRWLADPTYPDQSPRSHRYPQAGTANSEVSLWLIDLNSGAPTRIDWDYDEFEYLVDVRWTSANPLITLASRDQRKFETFELAGTQLQSIAIHTDPHWVDAGVGLPAFVGDRLLDYQSTAPARCLQLAGVPIDLAGRHVEQVLAVDAGGFVASVYNLAWQRQLLRVAADGEITPLSAADGYALGNIAWPYAVVVQHLAGTSEVEYQLLRAGAVTHRIGSNARQLPVQPRPEFSSRTETGLPTAVFWPSGHQPGSHRLPVVVSIYGGPHHSRVVASARSFANDQWLADHGFCVVVIDNRGTPGKGPGWEREVAGNLADPVITDQVAALEDILSSYPADTDGGRVGITGWSFGGFLSALAVLQRPDVYRAAWAGAPVTDWSLYDTAYTERYLGLPAENADAYRNSSLLQRAGNLRGELAIVHGLADDNVLAANSLQLSQALLAAGRPHRFLPLAGVSHMTPQVAVKQNLLLLMRDFFVETLKQP